MGEKLDEPHVQFCSSSQDNDNVEDLRQTKRSNETMTKHLQ
jgi:hypothetical protein